MLPKEKEIKKMSRKALQSAALLFEKEFSVKINRGKATEALRKELLSLLEKDKMADKNVDEILKELKESEEEKEESTEEAPEPTSVPEESGALDKEAIMAEVAEKAGTHGPTRIKLLSKILAEKGITLEEFRKA